MSCASLGPVAWSLTRDTESYRTYKVTYRVKGAVGDGPYAALCASGLPSVGSAYSISHSGMGGDSDSYAFRRWETNVTADQQEGGEPFSLWLVECTFTNKPLNRCRTSEYSSPLTEPIKYGGSFIKFTEEATYDYNGDRIKGISPFPPQGPLVEFDNNRPTLWFEVNQASLGLATFAAMIDNVNSSAIWGLAARCVKLSNVTWERKVYYSASSCAYYYTLRYEFECNYNTFDRLVPDVSPMIVKGRWNSSHSFVADPSSPTLTNPAAWMRAIDEKGNPTCFPITSNGVPATSESAINRITIKKYKETSFSTLGLPSSL